MCGFAGMLVRDGLSDLDLIETEQLGNLVNRRGPDDAGSWNDQWCAFAFRRLAIIDLSPGGHQPMASERGDHVVVFNGELYNFRELRSELVQRGRTFRSSSDTEVVLQSLAEWGEAAFSRFNGMFAIAWYRPEGQRLVLARDPLGIKPLMWWWSRDAVVFGSQYDQVVRHRRCDRGRVDQASLDLYLRLGYLPGAAALIEDTGQVPPGHLLRLQPGVTPVAREFRLPALAPPAEERLRGQAAADAVAEAVDAAVRRQSVSDVQMGAFLSGGVDSPLVTACLQEATTSPVPAFTIGTEDPASDETGPATHYASMLGVDHHIRRIGAPEALDLVNDVAAANTEPFGDYSSFPTLLVSDLASEHVKVVQSGDGGDELFWGYPRFAKVLAARKWFHVPRSVRVAAYGATKPLPVHRRPARGVMFPSLGDWYLDAHSGLRDRDFARIAPGLEGGGACGDLFRLDSVPDSDGLLQWMRRNELRCHLPMILQKVDRAAMYHSLEVRVPLLDMELVDSSARVDPSACLDGGIGKQVLRRALERHVPREAIPVPKRGFTVPMGEWLRTDLGGLVHSLLLDRDPFPAGVFDRRGLRSFYDDHASGRLDVTRGLWNLLALQLWADAHLMPLPDGL